MPKLAMCNFLSDLERLKETALAHGFQGIDWSFDPRDFPRRPSEESRWVAQMRFLAPLELRFHCPFARIDLGHEETARSREALDLFRRIVHLVAKAEGRYLTIHVGLGRDTTRILSWDRTVKNLRDLVRFGRQRSVRVCLENLAWGWTSKPHLFEKLVRLTGAGVTFDIGHAHACEAVATQQYTPADFVSPHADRLHNAHVYHTEIEIEGRGLHVAPETPADISSRLHLLGRAGCDWWVLELREMEALLQTKHIVDRHLAQVCAASTKDHTEFIDKMPHFKTAETPEAPLSRSPAVA